jgi:hypothetical protein
MTAFRAFLILAWGVIVGYTAIVISNHGLGLLSVFFGDMKTMAWPGQFNLDFTFMLLFSSIWVSWRHRFSFAGLLLGLLALFFGSMFFATYLFILGWQAQGDVNTMLLGHRNAPLR